MSAKEIPLKAWVQTIANAEGVCSQTIRNRLSRGHMPYPTVRRVNARVVLVQIQTQDWREELNA